MINRGLLIILQCHAIAYTLTCIIERTGVLETDLVMGVFGLDTFSNLFPSSSYQPTMSAVSTCSQSQDAILGALPAAYSNVNAVLVNNNLAVIPGTWSSGPIGSVFLEPRQEYR